MKQSITFDQVFLEWLKAEVSTEPNRDMLALAKQKGFGSIVEWRLNTARILKLDKKQWGLQKISNPNKTLPDIIIGPYQGWSMFFDNKLSTTFAQAMQIPEFFRWCESHNRIPKMAKGFTLPTTLILLQKTNGQLIHIEGGHRICATTFAQKIGQPINFPKTKPLMACVAKVSSSELRFLRDFLKQGTHKSRK